MSSARADDAATLFEQYRLAAEMADRISARRGTANAFYFTVGSALLAASETLDLWLASAAGILLSVTWWLQLLSYRKLSSAKWQVINTLESALPAHPFADEWSILKSEPVERVVLKSTRLGKMTKPFARYAELGLVEQVVPVIFAILFLIAMVSDLT